MSQYPESTVKLYSAGGEGQLGIPYAVYPSVLFYKADMARRMTRDAIARGDGAVLLFHPWTTATERALPPLIDGLREAGATFVQVDALA